MPYKIFFFCLKEFLKSVFIQVADDPFHHSLITAKKDVKPELQFSIMQNKTYTKHWHIPLYS